MRVAVPSERVGSMGDSIGYAIRACRSDFRFLFSKLVWPSVVELLGKILVIFGFDLFLAAQAAGGSTSGQGFLTSIVFLFFGLAFSVPAEIWLTLRQLAYVRTVVLRETDYEENYRLTRSRTWHIVLYALAFFVALAVWGLTCNIILESVGDMASGRVLSPWVALLLIGVIVFVSITALSMVLLPLCLIFPVIACEDLGPVASLKKSLRLTVKFFGRTFWFVGLLLFAVTILYVALTGALQIIYLIEYLRQFSSGTVKLFSQVRTPLALDLVGSIWHSLVYIYLMPVCYLSSGLFYLSLRAETEGIDLVQRLDEIDSSASGQKRIEERQPSP